MFTSITKMYNPGHNILEFCNALFSTSSIFPQVKRNFISSMAKLVYDLPRE